jgi:methylmalonyl-CoA mutase C-terminal domain/subunit
MKKEERRIRVLVAKPGLDGHDRGAKVLTLGLRDEGMEVIYTGIRSSAESIVQTCIEEAADVIGLSSLSGGHLYHFSRVTEQLAEKGVHDVLVIGGGIIPEGDISKLEKKGIKAVFGPGTQIEDVAAFIRDNI